jgi:hypothetical protein
LTSFRYILSHLLDLGRWTDELSFDGLVMMVGKWAESPHLGQCTPHLVQHLMEDIALGYAWTPLREVMLDHSTLDTNLTTLDIELLDDDIMH